MITNQELIHLKMYLTCSFASFPETVDLKDRGRRDGTAEAGLSAAATQERRSVAGVRPDLSRQTAPEATGNVSCRRVWREGRVPPSRRPLQ